MKICPKCQTKNQDTFLFCHGCGAELPKEAEVPCCEVPEKKKPNMIALVVAIVAALAVIAVGIFMIEDSRQEAGTPVEDATQVETPAGEAAVAHHVNAFGNQSYSIHYTEAEDGTYTYDYMNEDAELISVSQEEVDALLDAEIAACGDYVLTNRGLPYYHSESYYNISQMYGYFMSLLINGAQGMDEQLGMDGVNTWQHIFIQDGVNTFHSKAGIAMEAKAQGFDMTSVEAEVEAYAAQLTATAEQSGYEDVNAFLAYILGPGNTMEECLAYYELSVLYMEYMDLLASRISVMEDEIDAYYAENETTLAEQGITKVDKNVVDVRHILIAPEQTTNEDGTTSISDEAWAAAEAKAQEIYDQWRSGEATEETFAQLATENTTDPGSQQTGGLYEDVYPGQMVAEFNDWCFADGRKVGDHGLVKTSYGYHIMFFSGEGDYVYWRKTVEDTIRSERLTEQLNNILAKYPMEADLSKAILMDSIAPTVPSEENPGGVVIEEVDPSEVPVEHTHTHTEE